MAVNSFLSHFILCVCVLAAIMRGVKILLPLCERECAFNHIKNGAAQPHSSRESYSWPMDDNIANRPKM